MLPLLAQEIIYMCVTMKTFEEAENNQEKNILSPSNPILDEIHAVSSVLKAKTAWMSTEAIRESRRMMGGHGFSAYSKMGALYSNNDVNNTWEGENNVLIQQTTKYILQNLQKSMKGKEVKSPLLKFFNEVISFKCRLCPRRNSRQEGKIYLISRSSAITSSVRSLLDVKHWAQQ